jgi:glycosyltransferase involved in cell wall biosynthesis
MGLKPIIIPKEELLIPKGMGLREFHTTVTPSRSATQSNLNGPIKTPQSKAEAAFAKSLQWAPQPPRNIGIGIITYNRLAVLQKCVQRVHEHTLSPYHLVVADDGSTDGTATWLAKSRIPHITGLNNGCAVNKNRALGYFMQYTDCDPIILIEEDAVPNTPGWESHWIEAATKYGQINFATSYQFDHHYIGGRGSVDNPFWCTMPSAQCTVTRRDELERVGYLDSRFRGYGHEHVEWTMRMFRGREYLTESGWQLYPTLNSGFELCVVKSYENVADIRHNDVVVEEIKNTELYRFPYREDGTGYMTGRTFQLELRSAINRNPIYHQAPEGTTYLSDAFHATCAKPSPVKCANAVVTLATDDLRKTWLRSFLRSIRLNGGSGFKTYVMYEEGKNDREWTKLLRTYNSIGIPFKPIRSIPESLKNWSVKGLLYSVSQYVTADRYLCIDCDTLVLDKLSPVFNSMNLCPKESVYVAFDGNGWGVEDEFIRGATLSDSLQSLYHGSKNDIRNIASHLPEFFDSTPLICNSGVIAAPRTGMEILNKRLRDMMPKAWYWLTLDPGVPREQCLFNIACADGLGKELDGRFNWQSHNERNGGIVVHNNRHVLNPQGQRVVVLHFSGVKKAHLYPDLMAAYRARTKRVNPQNRTYRKKRTKVHCFQIKSDNSKFTTTVQKNDFHFSNRFQSMLSSNELDINESKVQVPVLSVESSCEQSIWPWREFSFDDKVLVALLQQRRQAEPTLCEARALLFSLLNSHGRVKESIELLAEFVNILHSESDELRMNQWKGEDLTGRRIIVFDEWGYGDSILFSRFIPRLALRGASILVSCRPELARLYERIDGVGSVNCENASWDKMLSQYPNDLYASMLELPYLLGYDQLDDMPCSFPYLHPSQSEIDKWSLEIGESNCVNIGIVWASGGNVSPYRNCELSEFVKIAKSPGVRLFSLQHGEAALEATRSTFVEVFSSQFNDFADTASAIAALDLVISVDTSVAHLAGALGKPVWILLPKTQGYCSFHMGKGSFWYPSMKYFTQTQEGEWTDVFDRVHAFLSEIIDSNYRDQDVTLEKALY